MKTKKYESGQALVFIVAAIIGLVAMTGLTVDGGMTYVDRQNAQSSADSAALGAALAKIRGQNVTTIALSIAATNGYINDTTHDTVTVTNPITDATTGCDGQSIRSEYRTADYIHVKIVTNVNAYFAPVVGITQTHNCVESIAKSQPTTVVPLFDGNAVVGLKPGNTSPCGFDSGNSNSKDWTLTGGGIFSNGCFEHPNGTLNIPSNKCITAVGGATVSGGGTHACVLQNQTAKAYAYPADIAEMMPENPCLGTPTAGRYPTGGKVPTSGQLSFSNDVYCITNLDAFDSEGVSLTNATLYVIDDKFDLKFAGGGGFAGTATVAGTYAGSEKYAGYYIIIAMINPPCPSFNSNNTQVIEFRGNGAADVTGTIFAPSACIDYRGNSNAKKTDSQVIGYQVSSNGNSSLEIYYNQADNGKRIVKASIELTK